MILDATIRAKGTQGLVFRTTVIRIDFIFPVRDFYHAFAANHTGITGIAFFENSCGHTLTADVIRIFELALGIVAGRKTTDGVIEHHNGGSSIVRQTGHVRVFGQDFGSRAVQCDQGLAIENFRSFSAAHNHSLQVFAGHHGAHTCASHMAIGHADNT